MRPRTIPVVDDGPQIRRAVPPILHRSFVALALAALWPSSASAQAAADSVLKVTSSAFVDSYYAWDFGRPPGMDRSFAGGALFTTQPARHNEFAVNLAFVDVRLDGARVRGRLALQAGTSVQSNYSGEPTRGVVSGPSLSRHLQEAFAGVQFGDRLWVDGGIFFSHIGMEGWISRDNPTYTRSLVADYSPYYSSGVRAVFQATTTLAAQFDVVNGWQNVSENNSGKGVGVRLDYTPAPGATLSYFDFFSDELGNRLRTFNGVGAKMVHGAWTWLAEADYGTQSGGSAAPDASWYGLTGVARLALTPALAVSLRGERFADENQIVVVTGQANPLRANGASVGLDVVPAPRTLWRLEARGFTNATAVFPDGTGAPTRSNVLLVSSLALSF